MHSLVKYLLLASLFLFIKPAQAQQGNVWAFGYQTGLDFNYSPPKVISSASRYPLNSNLPAFASTSVSDCNGKLLFYSNGTEVFDRNHERMPHGLLTNWSYGFIYAIKSPADSNKYYLFTSVDSFYQQYHNITYTVIDMSLNNGNGDVDTTQKNIVFHGKSKQMNTFTIVGNSNKKDYWVITNSYEEVIIYPLTKSGIGAPNYYNLPAKLDSNASVVGAFFANHKGSKLVLAQTYFEPAWAKYRGVIFDFNNTTGRISKSTPFMDKKLAEHFLVEFSPDDSLMYANTGFLTPRSESLYQFEVYATNIDNSRQLLKQENVTSGSGYFIMRLGPDNKIYVGKYQDTLMGIIHNPNRKGLKCNYKENEINLAPGYFGDMMPNVYFPVKNLDFRIKAGCTDTVRFTNLSDTSYFKNFKWYFGDGDSSSKYSPKHAYATSGKYFVKLLGINQCGAKQWYSDTIEVWVPAKPGFKKDTVIYSCGQALLYLSSTSKDSSQHYGYTFGDLLSADTSINPIHIYYKAGKYLLKQVVDNGYCKDSVTDSVTINIEAFPKADFTSLNTKGCTPLTVNFSNQSTDAFHYKWLYDNKTDTSKSPTHTFTDTGFHKVILLAYNNQGCVDSIIKDSFIYVSPQPKPQFTYTTKKVCAGIEATFQNQSIFSTKYIWNIDGKTDTTTSPVYTFRQNGNYQVTLTAINLYCQNTDTQTAHILLPDTVKSIFSSDRKAGCPNTEIAFINQSKHSVKQTWYFGDGDTSSIFSPKHIYDSAGKYNVSLVSYSAEGCKDSITLADYIHILPYPEALFSTDSGTYSCERVTYTYNNKSTNADSFRWSFGDGSPIQITFAPGTLTHSFGKSGEYKITITAFNGYCVDTAVIMQQIDLRKPPVADFTIENNKLCISNATTKFTNQSIFGDSYIWDFGDGTVDTNKNSTHTFTSPGKYNITLVVKSKEGCTHTKIWENAISVSEKINASFTADKTQGCAPLTVNFIPTKDTDTGLIYNWNFGNGKTSSQRNPTMVFDYGKQDSFYAKLVLTNKMCTDSFRQWIKILNLREDKDTAEITLATVENNQSVRLHWNKLNLAKQYLLQRSVNGTDFTYSTYTGDTTFLDTKTDVHSKSYYYKIAAIDECGGRSAQSPIAQTILLKAKVKGNDDAAELSWNRYQGFKEPEYNLLRLGLGIFTTSSDSYFVDNTYFDNSLLQQCYVVEAKNSANSLISQSNQVCLNYQPRIYIPNAFSPNGDNINEVFEIKTTGIKNYELIIYNRWGEKLFQIDENHSSWDGKFNGATPVEGVYHYIFKAKASSDQHFFRNGSFQIIK